jgi:hypothetical protein
LAVRLTNKLFATAALAVAVLASTATFAALGAVSNNKSLPSQGTIKAVNLGVYWDNACTNTTTAVNWGMMAPGSANNVTLYVRNDGNVAVKLNMTTQGWNPTNTPSYVTLTWNREGQVLNPKTVTTATLTLSVSASVSGITNFSFNIIMTGVEQ